MQSFQDQVRWWETRPRCCLLLRLPQHCRDRISSATSTSSPGCQATVCPCVCTSVRIGSCLGSSGHREWCSGLFSQVIRKWRHHISSWEALVNWTRGRAAVCPMLTYRPPKSMGNESSSTSIWIRLLVQSYQTGEYRSHHVSEPEKCLSTNICLISPHERKESLGKRHRTYWPVWTCMWSVRKPSHWHRTSHVTCRSLSKSTCSQKNTLFVRTHSNKTLNINVLKWWPMKKERVQPRAWEWPHFSQKKKKGDLAGVKYEMFCELRNGMKLALWTWGPIFLKKGKKKGPKQTTPRRCLFRVALEGPGVFL